MADLIFDSSLIVRFDEDGLTTSDVESNARMGDKAAANVIAVKRGVTPPNLITFGGASA